MRHHWDAWKRLSQEFGFSLTVEQLLGLAGKPSKEIMELLCEEQVGFWLHSVTVRGPWRASPAEKLWTCCARSR